MSSAQLSGLATVQDLYLLQLRLVAFMQGGQRSPDAVKEAKQCLRQFSTLLEVADPAYMGGEEVYEDLKTMRKEFAMKIGKHASRKATPARHRASAKQTAKRAKLMQRVKTKTKKKGSSKKHKRAKARR